MFGSTGEVNHPTSTPFGSTSCSCTYTDTGVFTLKVQSLLRLIQMLKGTFCIWTKVHKGFLLAKDAACLTKFIDFYINKYTCIFRNMLWNLSHRFHFQTNFPDMACQLRLAKNWNKALLSWTLAAERAAGWGSCQTECVVTTGNLRSSEEEAPSSSSSPSFMETWWKSSSSQIWSSLQWSHPDLGTNLFTCFHWTVSQFAYGYTEFSTWRNDENYQMWTCLLSLPELALSPPPRLVLHTVFGCMNKTFLCLLCL